MRAPELPEAMSILRAIERPTYDADVHRLVDESLKKQGPGDLAKLFRNDDTWVVSE